MSTTESLAQDKGLTDEADSNNMPSSQNILLSRPAIAVDAPNPTDVDTAEDAEEDPDAPRIREQVEYYFSDENLPHDQFLLELCGGRENYPISISQIRGFRKMRRFKKPQVIAALKKSAFLEVTDNDTKVKRRVPLKGRTVLDPPEPDSDDEGEIAYDPRGARPSQAEANKSVRPWTAPPPPPAPKPELPPGMTKNMMKPSGFEEYYAEAPITPAEFEEEEQIYDPDNPFVERIEIAIQRFKQKRKMHQMYSQIFSKWMMFGGVDSSPRMFTGKVSQREMDDMDAAQIARMLATHHVSWEKTDETKWVVDFEGVAKAFFASVYPYEFVCDDKEVKTAAQVLRSFYNYILHHDVCPEYTKDILAAREVCAQAERELVACRRASLKLPGAFNVAASNIFGGYHAGLYVGNATWLDRDYDTNWTGDDKMQIGIKDEEAEIVFKTGVAALGTDEQYELFHREPIKVADAVKVVGENDVGLRILSLQKAAPETQQIYREMNKTWKHKLSFSPLGRMRCETWLQPDMDEWDLPVPPEKEKPREYEFWVEDEAMEHLIPGMKMEATVLHLSCGIDILDSITQLYCSFYDWIPNEQLLHSKLLKEVRFLGPKEENAMEGEGGPVGGA